MRSRLNQLLHGPRNVGARRTPLGGGLGLHVPTPLRAVWLVAMPFAAWGQTAPVADMQDAEIAAFSEAVVRAEDRASALRADALQRYEQQRADQLGAIDAAYTNTINALEADERARRTEAIGRLEAFLARHTDIRATSDVRLRLAELAYQQAEEEWFERADAYNDALVEAGDDLDRLAALEAQGEPKADLSVVNRLLSDIVRSNAGLPLAEQYELLDVAYYMLAFTYVNGNAAQYDEVRALKVFRELTDVRPDSPYADAAHLLIGRYLFQDDKIEEAISEFETVIARGPSSDWFADAVYFLAWSRYRQSRHDEAKAGFVELLTLSQALAERTGKPSGYAPEAVTYIALSLLDEADAAFITPLERAQQFFATFEETPPWAWEVYRQLAEALTRYSRYDESIAAYRFLQADEAFRFRPENPEFQDRVVGLLQRGYGADLAAAGQAQLEMTELYGENSPWWEANRANPEAIATARRFIERYLLDVAVDFKVRAQEALVAGDPSAEGLFSEAAARYRTYLTRFPVSDGFFEHQFQLADALYFAGDIVGAEKEFTSLARNAAYHPFGGVSVFLLARTRQKLVETTVGPFGEPVADAPVERTVTLRSGKTLEVRALVPAQKAFVDAAENALVFDYGPPPEGVETDMRDLIEEEGPNYKYLIAQTLFYANRFTEARPRLLELVQDYPRTLAASYAATLYIDSYTIEEDYAQVRRWSREFASTPLGPDQTTDTIFFRNALEASTYELGVVSFKDEAYDASAEAFLSFVDEFPRSEKVASALLSAAGAYSRLGRFEDANVIYARFLKQFPSHPEAPQFYLRLAENFGSTFQLDKAVSYYRDLVSLFPSHRNAAVATYMIAFLQEGTGEHLAAAQGYEAYAQKFPDEADAEEVMYRAGLQYELVSDDRALAFYQRYLKRWGLKDADRAMAAQAQIAELYESRGRGRDAQRARAALLPMFDEAIASGATLGPKARDLAAEVAFGEVEALYQAVVSHEMPKDDKKLADLLKDTIPGQLIELDEKAKALIEKFVSFPYTTAAMYLRGAARAWYAEFGYQVTPPPGLSPVMEQAFWDFLQADLYPQMDNFKAQAIAILTQVKDLAKSQQQHSLWVDKASIKLNEIDPTQYSADKPPLVADAVAFERLPVRPVAPVSTEAAAGKEQP